MGASGRRLITGIGKQQVIAATGDCWPLLVIYFTQVHLARTCGGRRAASRYNAPQQVGASGRRPITAPGLGRRTPFQAFADSHDGKQL